MARSFAAQYPGVCREIKYEDLIARPNETLGAVLDFLGVDASNDVVQHCVAQGSFERLSGGRKRGEEDVNSFFRKGVIGDWRNSFDEPTLASFQKTAGKLLQELDYPLD